MSSTMSSAPTSSPSGGTSPSAKALPGWGTVLITIAVFLAVVIFLGVTLHAAGCLRRCSDRSYLLPLRVPQMSQRNDSLPTLYFEPASSVDSLSSTVPYIQPPPPAYINPPRYSIAKDPETATVDGSVHRVDIGRLQGIVNARTGATETEEIC